MIKVYFAVLADHKGNEEFTCSTVYAQSPRQAAFYGKQLLDKTMFAAKFVIHMMVLNQRDVAEMLNIRDRGFESGEYNEKIARDDVQLIPAGVDDLPF